MSEQVKINISVLQKDVSSQEMKEEHFGSFDERNATVYLRYTTDVEGNDHPSGENSCLSKENGLATGENGCAAKKSGLRTEEDDRPSGELVKNLLKVQPGTVEMIRSGAVKSHMFFRQGETFQTVISSGAISMQTETVTKQLEVSRSGDAAVKVRLVYDLTVNGQFVSQCVMCIEAQLV